MKTEEIERRIAALQAMYRLRFAGRARITRDGSLMANMVKEAGTLLDHLGAGAGGELAERIDQSRQTWKKELRLIREAQQKPEEIQALAELAERAVLIHGRYLRHFAGKNRQTRDYALLSDMISELHELLGSVEDLTAGLAEGHEEEVRAYVEPIVQRAKLYEEELGLIEEAIASAPPEQKMSSYAMISNEQFRLYEAHFAGKSRLSRFPQLLERMIRQLRDMLASMEALEREGFQHEANVRNRSTVRERLSLFEEELDKVREERSRTTLDQLVGAFGTAANQLFSLWESEYAGRPRVDRPLEPLVDLCDALADLERQSTDLDERVSHEGNRRNLLLMRDFLHLFSSEFDAIVEAKAKAASEGATG